MKLHKWEDAISDTIRTKAILSKDDFEDMKKDLDKAAAFFAGLICMVPNDRLYIQYLNLVEKTRNTLVDICEADKVVIEE